MSPQRELLGAAKGQHVEAVTGAPRVEDVVGFGLLLLLVDVFHKRVFASGSVHVHTSFGDREERVGLGWVAN